MAGIVIRDVSRAGQTLGGAELDGLPDTVTLRELLRARIDGEVADYNDDPGEVFQGLVQPADSVRHSHGHKMRSPRPLDADLLIAAAEEAVELGMLLARTEDDTITDLDAQLDLTALDRLDLILQRPVIARTS